jgi:MOSC domain-containing protein YiiM
MTGVILQISLSNGGVPKRAIDRGIVWEEGLQGDRQADLRAHGGPARAVCLYSFEVIERLRAEGHPIGPGATGENVTVGALDWSLVVPGVGPYHRSRRRPVRRQRRLPGGARTTST